jgi:hypothetical protein
VRERPPSRRVAAEEGRVQWHEPAKVHWTDPENRQHILNCPTVRHAVCFVVERLNAPEKQTASIQSVSQSFDFASICVLYQHRDQPKQ